MGARKYRNIEIRGVVYADVRAAAAALGVTPEAVRIARRRGTLHRVGTGAVGVEPMRVRVRGREFADVAAAAAHFGLTRHAIYTAIAEGREARVGLAPRRNGGHARPVRIGARKFASMAAADRALGFRPGYVSLVMRRGSVAGLQRILGAVMAEAARGGV